MPVLDKQQLLAFSKKKAASPLGANALAQKRSMAKAPAATPPLQKKPQGGLAHQAGEEMETHLFELAEEAAEMAQAGQDQELEQVIGSFPEAQGAEDPPKWATDADKWAEAAEAVGLGTGADLKYDEPFVVTAYLYKMIGGPISVEELPALEEVDAEPADMSKPGNAAKALQARAMARGASPEQ